MGQEQIQAYCHCCRRLTLHTRMADEVNHVLHLLLTVLLCGWWLPVWVLLIIVNAIRRGEPFRCTICGAAVGQPSPEQVAAQMQQPAPAPKPRHPALDQDVQPMGAQLEGLAEDLGKTFAAGWSGLRRLPGRIDRLLLKISGETEDDSRLLHRFLRCLLIGLLIGGIGAFIVLLCCIW